MALKVRATQRGFYDHLREPGDEFEIRDKDSFAESWMEPVGGPVPVKDAGKGGKDAAAGPATTNKGAI